MSKAIRILVLLLLVAGATLAMPGAANAASDIYPIQSAAGAGKCVGLANYGSTANGTGLIIWDCHYNADQWWYNGDGGTMRSYASSWPYGKCVGLANYGNTANGTALILWDCNYNPDQIWSWRALGNGNYALYNPPSGKCAGLANYGSTVNGTRLVIWDCHLNPDQQWN
ncbi:RICIN domain-containing protein [Hamadaea tsunoensis]|uniref:RICIN domain-containing protein n=1 Tax=Hamadaea tsunoensis TaxID=53368 RepID=UPI000403EF14|nr:RICIN domain-containing protein [Hamadaea tsunoensis]